MGVLQVLQMSRLAVLMACHNRVETTLSCLARLMPQIGDESRVFLIDDGSNDGTGTRVRSKFPSVQVVDGNGTLYWAKGMRRSWEAAVGERSDWDAYLWLNDDTMLNGDAIATMLSANDGKSLVVGELHDAEGKAVYGLNVNGWVNGNCVLVPRAIYERTGMICGEYSHAWADRDYAFRVKRAGFAIVGAGVVGTTQWHPLRPSLAGKSFVERWRLLFDPKGWNIHDLWLLRRRNRGFFAAIVSCLHLATHVILFNHERHKIHERFSSLSCG